jgi:hypothetical protein
LFQDVYCLKDGKPWEGDGGSGLDSGGFVGALCQSVIFVPLFSAYLKPRAPHDAAVPPAPSEASSSQPADLVASGSIGQMKYLSESNDKQDNVLLELILAMELHKYAVKMAHLGSFKSMFPCSVIFPLFQSTVVFDVTNSLSTMPSVITNQKALAVLKVIGITPSAELANGTLSVKQIVQFYGNFQGMKLYDYGAQIHQIDAAAKRLLQCIEDTFSDPFELFDANYTEAYELRNFLNSINMSHFSSAMVAHKISSVEQFAALDRNADGILGKLAIDASRVSRDSEVSEIIKLQAAVQLSQNSSLATPLEKRFQDFVDADAAFLTAAFSTSAVDIMLAKSIIQIALFILPSIIIIGEVIEFLNLNPNTLKGLFPESLELNVVYRAFLIFDYLLLMSGAIAAKFKSPRTGRYFIVAVLILFAIFCIFALIISVNDAVTTGCQTQCARTVDDNISKAAKVLVQALQLTGLGLFAASFAWAIAVRQDLLLYTGPIGYLVYWFCFQLPSSYLALGIIEWRSGQAYFCTFSLILLPLLQKVGHKRADKILFENQNLLNESFTNCLLAEGFAASDSESIRREIPKTSNFPGITMTERLVSNQTQASSQPSEGTPSCIIVNNQDFMDLCLSHGSSRLLHHVWETQTCRVESNLLQQTQASFTNLIRDAEFVNVAFQEWVSSWLKGGPTREEIAKYFFEDGGVPATSNASEASSLSPTNGSSRVSVSGMNSAECAPLANSAFTPAQLRCAGYSLNDLWSAGFTAAQLKPAFSASEMRAVGFAISDLKAVGYTAAELREASYTLTEMKSIGFVIGDFKKASFTAVELKQAEYTISELKAAGFTVMELKEIPVSLADLKSLGFTATQLKPAFTASEMVAEKFTLEDLKVAGYSASELKSAGYTVSDLKLLTSDKHLSNEPFKELYSDTFGQASGVHVRGPVKHVDRAISKAYRSYFGNFRRLTDIVRCSIILNTTADIQEFVKVHLVLCAFESACSIVSQKIVSNSWIRQNKMTKAQLMEVKPLLNCNQLPVTRLLQQ